MPGIYNEKGKAYRIKGSIGGVPNSRRPRWDVGSKYHVGAASDHKWTLGESTPYGHGPRKVALKAPRRTPKARSAGR